MRIEKIMIAGEGLFWIGLVGLTLLLAAMIGCSEAGSPLSPNGFEGETVGGLKSETPPVSKGKNLSVVKKVSAHSVAAAPSIVGTTPAGNHDLVISLSHEETRDNGDEVIAITATSGSLVAEDKIRLYADGDYLGRVKVASDSSPLSEIHVLLDDEDFGEGEVELEAEISRNGKVIADAVMDLDREEEIITGPTLEEVALGDFEDEIVLTFSDAVNARRAIKDNIDVVVDNERKRIRSYGEDHDEVTLIMGKDLSSGTYTISYNGEGGLEGIDGEEIGAFSTTLTVEEEIITGPTLEEVALGDFEDEIVLTFSDAVNARRAIKDNIDVVFDGKQLRIRSYEDGDDEITLIMGKDLSQGEHIISYNGEGGFEGIDGEEIGAFSTTLTVEEDEVPVPVAESAWKTIPHGIYRSGTQLLLTLEHFGYKVSPWTRQILGSNTFRVEEEVGETHLYRLTAEEIGLTGNYTAADVILAVVASGYKLVPDETAAQLRLLYPAQPQGELITVVSSPLLRGQGTYMLALGGGSAEFPGKHLIAVNTQATLGPEYREFVVTK